MMAGNGGATGHALLGPGVPPLDLDSSEAICYAFPTGNDSADGSTISRAKQDVMSCYDAIPGGTVFLLDGGHGVPLRACPHTAPAGCGIWIMGPADPDYSRPPSGWRKEKAISFVGGVKTGGEGSGHDYQTNILAGGPDSRHPGIWLSSTSQITFVNLSITSCLPALVGRGSNRNSGNRQDSGTMFDNVGFWASASVGCGPGLLIVSSSGRNLIRHSQIRGSTLEHALVSKVSRHANIVNFTAASNLPSSWTAGTALGIDGVSDPSFDGGNFAITVTGPKTFTYWQRGPDATSAGGRATSDGSQAIVMNPHGAQGSSLYASYLSLHDGAIKVYAGSTDATLQVRNVVQEHGSDPAVWIATCASATIVNALDVRVRAGGNSGSFTAVRSDCASNAQTLASTVPVQNTSFNVPVTALVDSSSLTATANPRLADEHITLEGPSRRQPVFAVQVGAFSDPANANRLKAVVEASYAPVVILRSAQGGGLYRVCVGRESSESAARELAEKLRQSKLAGQTLIVKVD
jgi:cell division septation protein DedD